MLPSAIDPHNQRARIFQPRRKDSTISGTGSDSGSSTAAMSKFVPKKSKDASLRPTTADSAVTDMTERTLIQSESDDGRMIPSGARTPPGVADARMRRLLHELDSIGLTDEMSSGRPSQDIDEWATSSSIAHGMPPAAPLTVPNRYIPPPRGEIPTANRITSLQEDADKLQRSPQIKSWQSHSPSASLTRPHLIPPHRNIHPDAPETASPASPNSEVDDARINPYYGTRPDVSPLTAGQSAGFPRQSSSGLSTTISPLSRTIQANQQHQGFYQPTASAPLNSSAFPMPPRLTTSMLHQQATPPPTRSTRRPGTAGGDPPVAFFNNNLSRGRYGSDQNLREKYLSTTSGSQSSGMGISPISPISAPAMTISTSVSRTNSTNSGALETPVDGMPLNANLPTIQTSLNPIQEKRPTGPSSTRDDSIISPGAQTLVDVPSSSPASTARRGSVDSGTMLKSAGASDTSRERNTKSPIDLAGPSLNNPFLGGGFGGGLSFGGVGFAIKDTNPPPYRVHSPPSSGNGRASSLRAGSVGGKSDGSGSSFGDGVGHTRGEGTSKKATPAVALATAFVKEGIPGFSAPATPVMSKAEKAAEKARLKAEKAAQKAEEARRKVEEEKEAKLNAEELKRKKKEEKILKRLHTTDVGVYGMNGMGMIH
ncbi:hypothetical protein FRB91_004691 [Serendipita sp. 411]|nr:hypothetical protein FRB91_004691 [Serendipita sp. 411]